MKPKAHQFVTTEDEALSALRTLKSLRDGERSSVRALLIGAEDEDLLKLVCRDESVSVVGFSSKVR